MVQTALERVPYPGLSRLHQQFLRQGLPDPTSPPVQPSALGQEANLGGVHWLPERRQILHHQHPPLQTRLQRGAHPGRDQGVAVHHLNAPDLPD